MKAMKQPLNDNGYAPLLRGKDLSNMGPILSGIYLGIAISGNILLGMEKAAKSVANGIYSGCSKIGNFFSGMSNYATNTVEEFKYIEAYKKRHKDINQGNLSEEDKAFLTTQMPKVNETQNLPESIARINAATRNLQKKETETAVNGERLRQLRYGDLAPRRSRSEELANNRRLYEQQLHGYSSEEERIEDERRGREMRERTERAREMRRQETSNDHIRSHKLDMHRGR